ncbi:UNVERIFIED_CONTAM: hypothetical protein FKN15_077736 [Acipenser sinensis]
MQAGILCSLAGFVLGSYSAQSRVWHLSEFYSLDLNLFFLLPTPLPPAAVIKMEGGTEHDLRILEQTTEEEENKHEKGAPGGGEPPKKEEQRGGDSDRKPADKEDKKEDKGESGGESVDEKIKKPSEDEGEKSAAKEEPESKKVSKKRKRKHSGDDSYDEDEGSASDSESESESEKPAEEEEEEEEKEEEETTVEPKEKEEEDKPKEERKGKEEKRERKGKEEKRERKGKEVELTPRPLHKTCSLFMRGLAPNISKAEIVALCRRYPGFMRVALSDPQQDRRFFRRGWVTFDRSVNIKEICWSLQNIRLRDCELSPVVNKDLVRRVRYVSGITQHKQVLRNDIKLSAKLIHAMDERELLWRSKDKGKGDAIAMAAQNPLLKNITDYLIEEVSAEEEELLGSSGDQPEDGAKEGNPTEVTIERDDKLVKVLDRLLLYLRIVHSIDYYNSCEYQCEDEMPNRCGLLHVRGPVPPNRITHGEVVDWQKTFEEKLNPLFSVKESISEEEAKKMGKKDPGQEVEKFVSANTQELGKEKWLCPLSGKKFKLIGSPTPLHSSRPRGAMDWSEGNQSTERGGNFSAGNQTCGNIDGFKYSVFLSTYAVICPVGLITNSLALYVFLRLTPNKSPNTVFTINLAASDLFFALTLPYRIVYYSREGRWDFPDWLCRVCTFSFYVNLYASILFLTALSVFRYVAVLHPMKTRTLITVRRASTTSLGIWVFVSLSSAPFLLSGTHVREGKTRCFEPRNAGSWKRILIMNYVALVLGFLETARSIKQMSSKQDDEEEDDDEEDEMLIFVIAVIKNLMETSKDSN